MNDNNDIIAIGESLIELSTNETLTDAKSLDKYYGGDTLTTAIAALRLGSKVGFISRIGMDCFQDYLIESWSNEGLDISHVKPVKGINALYMVSKSSDCSKNELSFYRKKTAATNLSIDDISSDYIKNSHIVYSTGMTQSLSISAAEAVKKAFSIAKENNILTAYDPNFSSLIWSKEQAKEAFDDIAEFLDIIFLNTKYDSEMIIDSVSINNTIKSLWDKGISTVIIKSSEDNGYYLGNQGNITFEKYYTTSFIDKTGAGDTFNGGFLHAAASGMNAHRAVKLAAITAGLQVQNYGAVKSIPNKDDVYKIFKGLNE